MTYQVNVTGFKTKQQAEQFVEWYEGQGEQDAAIWFECRKDEGTLDVDFMPTDCSLTYPLQWDENTLKLVLRIEQSYQHGQKENQ